MSIDPLVSEDLRIALRAFPYDRKWVESRRQPGRVERLALIQIRIETNLTYDFPVLSKKIMNAFLGGLVPNPIEDPSSFNSTGKVLILQNEMEIGDSLPLVVARWQVAPQYTA
jgi:hypothetical protein